jgi:hypothetical protein
MAHRASSPGPASSAPGQSVLVINGIVTGGSAFLGGTMTETLAAITNQSAQCLTPPGVTSGGGPVDLNIVA